jgi:phosphatidylglycerol---prolipoprotein diacylglyceryl transferase
MYPYIHIGSFSLGTFGLMLWLAAVCSGVVLHRNFARWHINADALGIVAITTVAGIVGAKLWNVLEEPQLLVQHPVEIIFSRQGFAWFGGLLAGILALLWEGRSAKIGPLAMLDLASPAAAVGYGVGRIGCLTSGDGDYGIHTNLPWGMSFPHGTDPTLDTVHPTPIYELIVALMIGWVIWRRGAAERPVGQITGEYLVLSGIARFLVEFIRINPKIYYGMSNAQVASLGSIVAGCVLIWWSKRHAVRSSLAQIETSAVS